MTPAICDKKHTICDKLPVKGSFFIIMMCRFIAYITAKSVAINILKGGVNIERKAIRKRWFSHCIGKSYVSVMGEGYKAVPLGMDACLLFLQICGFSHGGIHKAC